MPARPAPTPPAPRAQTRHEERANALSHGLGLLLATASLPVVIEIATRGRGNVLGAAVFCATMTLVFFASTVYHALPQGRAKDWFNRLDHAAIFVFIAGSFTPFALDNLQGLPGQAGFAAIWLLALAGVGLKAMGRLRHPLRSTALYVVLGWLAGVAVLPVLQRMAPAGQWLLAGGGLAYTVGAVFFLLDQRLRYGHFVWHLFVLGGCGCHFAAALLHSAGTGA
jgi:hemolysin III